LHSPKPILTNSNKPYFVTNAVFCLSLGLIRIWWKAELASNLENHTLPVKVSKHSSMRGKGNTSFLVTLFNFR
jgi:hypothetical protein